jgi:hypothetical protein
MNNLLIRTKIERYPRLYGLRFRNLSSNQLLLLSARSISELRGRSSNLTA